MVWRRAELPVEEVLLPAASGDTVATTSNLSITEIDQTGVSVVSSGNALPAPIVLGPATVPDTYAPDLGGGNIESTPIQPARSALDNAMNTPAAANSSG